MNYSHIVNFGAWCKKCKHFPKTEEDEPCCDCLNEPITEESRVPVYFEERKEK